MKQICWGEVHTNMTKSQLGALRWLANNPSHRARWLDKDGKLASGGRDTCTHFEIAGSKGTIKISAADMCAIQSYISNCPTTDKMYGVNEAGKALLQEYP